MAFLNRRGSVDDRVQLRLGNDPLLISESYEVRSTIFAPPASFSLHLGQSGRLKDLIAKYPPRTPFELFIGDVRQQTGATDGFVATDSDGGSAITIEGRDVVAPFHDGMVAKEQSFTGDTYINLVAKIALEVNATRPYDDEPCITFGSNGANRELLTGARIVVQSEQDSTLDQIETTSSSTVVRQIRAKLGESWLHFLTRHLDPAGLFLWASSQGNLIVSRPNPNQAAYARIYRDVNGLDESGNAVSAQHRNITRGRYSHVSVFTRGRGKRFGRSKLRGGFEDDEMVALGYDRELVLRDVNATDEKQAEFIARRHIAETRREGWSLTYTMSGHSTPAISGGGRVVWAPDTIVHVVDRILGIDDTFYLSEVTFRRSPHTTTELTLLRPKDLIFGGVDLIE